MNARPTITVDLAKCSIGMLCGGPTRCTPYINLSFAQRVEVLMVCTRVF